MSYRKVIEEINETLEVMPIDKITLQVRYDYGENSSNTVTEYKELKVGKSYRLGSGDVILNQLFHKARHILEELEDETGISPDQWENNSRNGDYRFLELTVIEIEFENGLTWDESEFNYIIEPNLLLD